MELKDYNFRANLIGEIRSLSSQMRSTPEETIEMCLRMHLCLPVPKKWEKDSWIVNKLEIIR
jgi:hypothetical protein